MPFQAWIFKINENYENPYIFNTTFFSIFAKLSLSNLYHYAVFQII